jgi:DtxR family transcriptional regulator, manganese transport regulator
MKQISRPAAGHRRTRNDHAAETAEDYVEAVADLSAQEGRCRVVDLAQHFGVSHVTVTKIISRLQRDGLVDTQKYGPIALTDRGKQLAAKSRRRHQIVYDFLLAIGVSEANAAIDAEGIEHHVGSETLQKLEEYAAARLARKPARKSKKRATKPAP